MPSPESLQVRLARLIASMTSGAVAHIAVASSLGSTQLVGRRLLGEISEAPPLRTTLLIALSQTRGIGRGGRSWQSPPGGLYLTWVSSSLGRTPTRLLPMVAAVSALEAVASVSKVDVKLKWPNDLVAAGAKLGGVIVHTRHGPTVAAAVGVGINVWNKPLLNRPAISLCQLTILNDDRELTLAKLASEFSLAMRNNLNNPDSAIKLWAKSLVHSPGDKLELSTPEGKITGLFDGVTPEGFIKLKLEDGSVKTVASGFVE